MQRPIDKVLDAIGRGNLKPEGTNTWKTQCPAHADGEHNDNWSLQVTEESDGKVLFHCFGGCETSRILPYYGLKMTDLFPQQERKERAVIEKTYDYVNVDGELLYQVVRYKPKSFRQRRPDGTGGWIWKLGDFYKDKQLISPGVDRVLYHLPEVVAGIENDEIIHLCEGEKDADNLREWGLPATTNAGGAKNFTDELGRRLTGARVAIYLDNDSAGIERAKKLSKILSKYVKETRVLTFTDLPEHSDISDWINKGHDLLELAAKVENAPNLDKFLDSLSEIQPERAQTDPSRDEEGQSDITSALEYLRSIQGEIDANPRKCFENEVIGALATVKKESPRDYGLFKAGVKGKIPIRELEASIKQVQAERSRLRVVSPDDDPVPLEEILPDIPFKELNLPHEWTFNEKGVRKLVGSGEKLQVVWASPVPIILTKRLRGIDTGEEKVELAFYRDNQWHYVTGTRSSIFNRTSIITLADKGLPVSSETAKFLVQWLGDLEASNLGTLPIVKSVNHLGWAGKYFIPGYEGDVTMDLDDTSKRVVAGYREKGELGDWFKHAAPYRQEALCRFLISAAFAGPLLRLVGQRTFTIYNWCNTGGGKSAAAYLATSVWGNPEIIKGSLNGTMVGTERQAALYSDLPLLLDEKEIDNSGGKQFEKIIYMLSQGKGRTRGNKEGGLQNYSVWRSVILTNGENPATSNGTRGGVQTRIIELYGKPIPDVKMAKEVYAWTARYHGTAGIKYIQSLMQYTKNEPQGVTEDYEAISAWLDEVAGEKSTSHTAAIATVMLADYYSSKWVFGLNDDVAFSEMQTLGQAILQQLKDTEDIDDSTRAWDYFWGWLGQNALHFKKNADIYYGWTDGNGKIYIYPHVFAEAMDKQGFNSDRILRDWYDKDLIEKGDRKGETRRRFKIRKYDPHTKIKNVNVIGINIPELETDEWDELSR